MFQSVRTTPSANPDRENRVDVERHRSNEGCDGVIDVLCDQEPNDVGTPRVQREQNRFGGTRRVEHIGELFARDLQLVEQRARNRPGDEDADDRLDENKKAELPSEDTGRAPCRDQAAPRHPVDEPFHASRVLNEREQGADHDAHHDDAGTLTILEKIGKCLDRIDQSGQRIPVVQNRPPEPDAGHEREVDLLRPHRQPDGEKGWQQRQRAVLAQH